MNKITLKLTFINTGDRRYEIIQSARFTVLDGDLVMILAVGFCTVLRYNRGLSNVVHFTYPEDL